MAVGLRGQLGEGARQGGRVAAWSWSGQVVVPLTGKTGAERRWGREPGSRPEVRPGVWRRGRAKEDGRVLAGGQAWRTVRV